MTQQTFDDPGITREEWDWVRSLIADVERESERDAFVGSLIRWDMAVKQFRKMEQKRMLLQAPTEVDVLCHKVCLHALLTLGNALLIDVRKFSEAELKCFRVRKEDVTAYVQELEQTFREWHHGFGTEEIRAVQQSIFGGAA